LGGVREERATVFDAKLSDPYVSQVRFMNQGGGVEHSIATAMAQSGAGDPAELRVGHRKQGIARFTLARARLSQ
jgi:hypothetical protein